MHRTARTTLAVAALPLSYWVPPSPAQVVPVGLTILVERETLLPGESTTIRLEAFFDRGNDYAIAVVGTWLDSSAGAQGLSDVRLVGPLRGPGTVAGTIGERGVRGIVAGQLHFPLNFPADPSNPMLFWEATYTAPAEVSTPFTVDLETRTSRFDVYIHRESVISESRLDGILDGTASIRVVPAPASVLVLVGLACVRSRRRGA